MRYEPNAPSPIEHHCRTTGPTTVGKPDEKLTIRRGDNIIKGDIIDYQKYAASITHLQSKNRIHRIFS